MSSENFIKSIIEANGPISMTQFMGVALSDPRFGYYMTKQPLGSKGDFITAPEVSQMFGEMIGIWTASVWEQMKKPEKLAIVEMGPGKGTLMSDFLLGTQNVPNFHNSIEIHLIEISPVLIEEQKRVLQSAPCDVIWHENISSLPQIPTIFIGNEFFDALPVHQFIKTADGWREKLVGIEPEKNELAFYLSPTETPACAYIDKDFRDSPEDSVYEFCPAAAAITSEVSEHILKFGGAALFIDYGYNSSPLVETVQSVKSHEYHNPLENIGEADLTAHVDFGNIAKVGEDIGLKVFGAIGQGKFLSQMGIELRAAMLLKQSDDEEERKKIISQLERLIKVDQMGELFKAIALVQPDIQEVGGFEDDNMFEPE